MFKNYLKVILRNIFSHKVYSLINILGLSIGITCSILIFLWVQDELRYDKFHVNADELFLVKLDQKYVSNIIASVTTTPGALGPALEREYPEILKYGRMSSIIILILSKEFTKWVLVANVIGWTIAYLIMNQFLRMFAYRINFTFLMFLSAAALSLIIALLTISFQTVKAATRNPVYALKHE